MAACPCKQCGGSTLKRVSREGFLDNMVFSRLGYYPWKCKDCGVRVRLKERGDRKERGRYRSQQRSTSAVYQDGDAGLHVPLSAASR